MSWLKAAMIQVNKPKQSVIAILKKHLGGQQDGRDRSEVHASDITKPEFCPRRWAFLDLQAKKSEPEYIPAAMDVTFQMGLKAEELVLEEWAGEHAIGNWECIRCHDQRTLCSKPQGYCKDGQRHLWKYRQLKIEAPDYGVTGSIDAIFDVGVPKLLFTELKTLNPKDFETIVVPQPEHRLRTNLYMKLTAESDSVYKDKFNLLEARVLYISRGYGKANPEWNNEILPFKEFVVNREDKDTKPCLQKAKALKLFREGQGMCSGICGTALDKTAQKCDCCKVCFSGQYPAVIQWETL